MDIKQNPDLLLVSRRYPHIGQVIELLWGEKEFNSYVLKLMNDTRNGERAGFPVEVASALLSLSLEHDFYYPHHTTTPSIWNLTK
jgi:hypothetical protein